MGFWFALFLWAVGFVLQDYFRPKLPSQEPSGEGDFQFPTATEGRKIPQVVGGTVKVKGPNTLWVGEWEAEPVTVETGMIFKKDETVGYKYKVALALGQFIGETAGMSAIYIGDDKVWDMFTDNSGNPASVADIDLPGLFGGEREGGGFQGRVRAFLGTNSQTVSTFLADRVPLQSAWPGMVYVVITDLTETSGAIIGESNQLRDIRIEWQCYKTLAQGDLGNTLSLTGDQHIIGRDANPIECAYRVLNAPDFGISTNEINYTNFQTVAATCYTEGIGYSQLIDSEQEAYSILAEIEKHIDGYIGPNPQTGLIEVKLARADYVIEDEFQATEENIIAINEYAKPEWPQTKNEVKVRFVNREKDYTDDHAVAQDMAGRLITGRPQSITVRFPGLRAADAANRIVARASRAYFWPLEKMQLEMDRTAYAIRPGDVVVVTHSDINATLLPCRVTRTSTGDPVKQTIKLDVVADVFADETGLQAAPPASEWIPATDAVVAPITNFDHINAPRWIMRKEELEFAPHRLWMVARDAPNNAWQLSVARSRDVPFGGGFTTFDPYLDPINVYSPMGFLAADTVSSPELGLDFLRDTVNQGAATVSEGGVMYVDEFSGMSSLPGSYIPNTQFDGMAIINPGATNEEYVAFRECSIVNGQYEFTGLYRGIETPISQHAVGEPVYFLDRGAFLELTLREGDESYSAQHQLTHYAPGGASAASGYIYPEQLFDNETYRKPNPPAYLIFPQLSTSVLFADGDLDASQPDSFTAPNFQGVQVDVYNRKHEQTNFIAAAGSLEEDFSVYDNNDFVDRNPTVNMFVYNLDTHPTPVRGNQLFEINTTGAVNRAGIVQLTQEALQTGGAFSPLNARLEITIENTASPAIEGVLAGVESRSQWIDKVITFNPQEFTYEMGEETLLLLHFTGETGTTKVIDYGWFNHPVTLKGNLEISQAVADDDFSGHGSPNPRSSPQQTFPSGHLSLTAADTQSPDTSPLVYNVCEVTDVSPKALSPANMDQSVGYMVQARVRFNGAPAGLNPIVTRWRTSDNQRAFWFGVDGLTMRCEHSNDGVTALAEATGNLTWNTGQWYELTWTVNDDYTQYFRDGVFVANDFHSWGDMFESAAPVIIGGDADGDTVAQDMQIDEVRITKIPVYRAPYTKHQRPYLGREHQTTLLLNWENTDYAVGSPGGSLGKEYVSDDLSRFPIEFPNLGSTNTFITDGDSKFGTRCLSMDGIRSTSGIEYNDGVWIRDSGAFGYLDAGSYEYITNFGFRDFTCEMWVKFNTLPFTADGAALITKYWRGVTGTSPWGDFFWEFTTAGQMFFSYDGRKEGFSTYDTGAVSVGSPELATGQWYHVAMVRKDGNFSMFFDGRRIFYDTSGDAAINMDNGSGAALAIGRRFSTSSGTTRHRTWDGFIDEVRITNGTAHYDGATYTVPTAAFPVPDRENDPAPPSPQSPTGPPSPQSPQGPSPASPQDEGAEGFAGAPADWTPEDL